MDVVRALIGVDRLKVLGVAHDVIFDLNAVAAMHVAGLAGDIQRLAAIVALDDGDHFRRHLMLVHQLADAQRCLKAERDFGLHVGELLLVKLHAGERLAELLAVETILPGAEPAIFRSPHDPQEMP